MARCLGAVSDEPEPPDEEDFSLVSVSLFKTERSFVSACSRVGKLHLHISKRLCGCNSRKYRK